MYNDDKQADRRNTLRLSVPLRSMAEQSARKQLRDVPMPGEYLTTRLLAITESRNTLLTEGKQSYSLRILAVNHLLGGADVIFNWLGERSWYCGLFA